uniref:Uncharacterized protein n=1 Tax=Physcomitrium patens TaxID=3218 RepID=A0A2K1IGY7_PHYPA|nr:hypothetical protein PHYPA_029131 [Physcomitrium patens]
MREESKKIKPQWADMSHISNLTEQKGDLKSSKANGCDQRPVIQRPGRQLSNLPSCLCCASPPRNENFLICIQKLVFFLSRSAKWNY